MTSTQLNSPRWPWFAVIAFGLLLLLMLSSCGVGQLITGQTAQERQTERKCSRATKRIEKAVTLCPSLRSKPVIVRDTVTVLIPEVKHDTVVLKADTIEIVKDRWRVRIIDRIDSLYIEGGCDSIYVNVPVEVECPPQIAPTVTLKASLKWWQIALMVLGVVLIWRAIVITWHHFANKQ
jgi:hypothetical protein